MRVVPGPIGSFLCPPGHPNHSWHIESGRTANPNLIASLDYAVENKHGDVSKRVQDKVAAIFAAATIERTEDWERSVYAHFVHCYSPDGVRLAADDAVIDKTNSLPVEHHLGFLYVRRFFPDATPRLDLIAA